MSVTIKDVARITGVSISTVSKVVNGSPRISQPTIDKVNEAIKSLNYVPNKRARDLASKFTRRIVFITLIKRNMAFINPHLFEIMIGAQKAFSNEGYAMEFIGVKSKDLKMIKDIIESKTCDGILIHASALNSEIAKYIVKSKFAHTVIGMPNYPNGVCWIDNNNQLSGEIAAKHLINM
ncbi:MAG: LacI family transcriptional regulator, partial [Firmicutes bacterium]|nr:LacI family transcriptional regulator [Bacillota bacterium]